jgi:hypothetical protein
VADDGDELAGLYRQVEVAQGGHRIGLALTVGKGDVI